MAENKNQSKDVASSPQSPTEPAPIIDVINYVGLNKFHYLLVFFCFAVHFSVIVQLVVVSYVMTTAAKELKMGSLQKGILGAMSFSGMVIGAFFWGVAMDAGGRHLSLSVALVCDAVVGFFSSFAATFPFLAFSRFLTGFFVQGSITTALTHVGEYFPPAFRSRGVVIFGAGPGVANIVLAGSAWLIHGMVMKIVFPWGFTFDSWRILLAVASIPSVVLSVVLEYFPETPLYLIRHGRDQEALAVMQRIWAFKSKLPGNQFPVNRILVPPADEKRSLLQGAWFQIRSLFKRENLRKTCILSFVSFSVITGYNGTLIWVPEIVTRIQQFQKANPGVQHTVCVAMENTHLHFHTDQDKFDVPYQLPSTFDPEIYIVALIIGSCVLLVSIIGCFVVSLLGNKPTLIVLLFTNSLLCVGLVFMPGGMTAFIVLMALLIPFGVLSMSAYSAITLELYETEIRGMAINIVMMFGRLGSMICNYIFGHLVDSYCEGCFSYVGTLLFLSGILTFFVPSGRRPFCHSTSNEQTEKSTTGTNLKKPP